MSQGTNVPLPGEGAVPATAEEQLARTVVRLRAELDDCLRRTPRPAAVEQAKGVLMERYRLSPAAAVEELEARAVRAGRTVPAEAWAVLDEVATGPPPRPADGPAGAADSVFAPGRCTGFGPPSTGRPAERPAPAPRPDHRRAQAGPETSAAAAAVQELVESLAEQLAGPTGVSAVLLYALAPLGGLELIAQHGVETGVATAWRHLPPIPRLAPVETARLGRPVWLNRLGEDLAEGEDARLLVGDRPGAWASRAWLPVYGNEQVTGVVGFLRRSAEDFTRAERSLLEAAAGSCFVPTPLRGPGAVNRPTDRVAHVQAVLDTLTEPVALLTPVRDGGGAVVDFLIEAASPKSLDVAGRSGPEMVGQRVLERYPTIAGSEVWRGYLRALSSGDLYESGPFEYEEVRSGVPRTSSYSLRATRLGDALVVSWSRQDTGEREAQRLRRLQHLGHLGWADWNLATDSLEWSPQVFTIFDRDPRLGPVPLDELPRHLVPDDLPTVGAALHRLLVDGAPLDVPFRIRTAHGSRHLRIVAEAVCDADGVPVEVHGFFQDLTRQAEAEQALDRARRAASSRQRALHSEHLLATRLQNALLPVPDEPFEVGGLRCEVSYRSAERSSPIGGDWFTALELPDGSALIGVGDVAGHGIEAAAAMAQLRYGAEAMALSGTEPQQVLERLNTVLLAGAPPTVRTATMLLTHYQPATRTLTWAQAGHLPMLHLRDGAAAQLPRPTGRILGADHDSEYRQARLDLRPGDRFFLFTDGLVERHGEELAAGLARLRSAVENTTGDACTALAAGITRALGPANPRDDTCLCCVLVL